MPIHELKGQLGMSYSVGPAIGDFIEESLEEALVFGSFPICECYITVPQGKHLAREINIDQALSRNSCHSELLIYHGQRQTLYDKKTS